MHTTKDGVVTPAKTAAKTKALFAHVRWQTKGQAPLLVHEDVAQAAHVAVAAQAKFFRCRTLAIGGPPDELHAIFGFPASMPLSTLTLQIMKASSMAVAQALSITHGRYYAANSIWDKTYGLRTLNPREVTDVISYVQQYHAEGIPLSEWETDGLEAQNTNYRPLYYLIREPGQLYSPEAVVVSHDTQELRVY